MSRRWCAGLLVSATVLLAGLATQAPARASVTPSNDFEYSYVYTLSYPPQPGPQAVLRMATRNFTAYFPFSGCPQVIGPGLICPLQGPNGNDPIRVESITATSFTFRSLPGHAEGADRMITFSFYTDSVTNRLYMKVHAWGPSSAGVLGSVATGFASGIWQQYATSLQDGIATGDYNNYPGGTYTLGSNPLSAPAIAMNADGRLETFALGDDGAIHHDWQDSAAANWNGYSSLGGSMWSGPSVVRNADGRLEVFAIGSDYSLQHAWQKSAGGTWSGWSSLSSGGHNLLYARAAVNQDGRVEVFALDDNGHIWHIWQQTPGASWSGWSDLGGTFESPPAMGTNSDGRMEVFALDSNYQLEYISQLGPSGGGGWSGWSTLGGWQFRSDPVVASNADGRLEVFAVGTDSHLDHIFQNAANGGWGSWSGLGGSLAGAPVAGVNSDGRLEIFARDTSGAISHVWQTVPGTAWSGWSSLGGLLGSTLAVETNVDGRQELIAMGVAGDPFHIWQTAPNGGWSGWAGL